MITSSISPWSRWRAKRLDPPSVEQVVTLVAENVVDSVRDVDAAGRRGGEKLRAWLARVSITLGAQIRVVRRGPLRARISAGVTKTPALSSLERPLSPHDLALAEHERRHAQLQEANEQLVLAALTAQELQAAAQHAHRQQLEFLAVLAHELRNPLTPIRTSAALLCRLPEGELPKVQAVIERQVAPLSRLVDDLLDVSRVVTGKLRLAFETVDLASTIDQAVRACRPAMDTRQQQLRVRLPPQALPLRGDPVRLGQVVSNLLDNASKYTPDGGEIALTAVVVDGAIVITVSDSGIGIATEALPRVFEPFVQDARAIGFNGAGLGIGLTVVRELVEGHGGSVVARSAGIGLGSQFVVTLPLAVAGANARAARNPRACSFDPGAHRNPSV